MTGTPLHTDSSETDVLIVGGGPIGLMLACLLRRADVEVTVVDRARAATRHSKATLIWPRSLELLEAADVAEDIVAVGHRIDAVTFNSRDDLLRAVDLNALADTRYAFGVSVRQSTVEDLLRRRLDALGGVVVAAECTAVVDRGAHVTVVVDDGAGERELTARWVVGADGVDSLVRTAMGAEYEGYDVPAQFILADSRLAGDIPRNRASYFFGPDGSLAVGPIGDDLYRVAWSVSALETARPDDPSHVAEVIRSRSNLAVDVELVHYSAAFKAQVRHASAFRSGRLLLAGDAAHRMTPASGQGMNTGFGDAAALGWRLAGVVHGRLDSAQLDVYASERAAAARQIEERTSAQSSHVDDWSSTRRGSVGPIPVMTTEQLAQFDVGDRVDVTYRGIAVGLGIPIALDAPTVVCWPGTRWTGDRWAGDRWAGAIDELAAKSPSGTRIIDAARMGNSRPPCVRTDHEIAAIIRPDGHLEGRYPLDEVVDRLIAAGWR
ncbi:MAG: NAD(P)/FAD-dependent oxidoreductase [Corynebacteriales bacterium]|nr:NAD(P)/FAD-dependent oxidoreductase [Mycobacteriales bacterium]